MGSRFDSRSQVRGDAVDGLVGDLRVDVSAVLAAFIALYFLLMIPDREPAPS